MVDGKPENGRTRLALGDIVIFIPVDGSNVETLGIIDGSLAVAVNHIVNSPFVAAVEYSNVKEVLAEESFVGNLCDLVLAVLSDDDDFREVGAVADVFAAIVLLESDTHEALGEIGVELGVVVDDLRGGDGLEGSNFSLAREEVAVFLLQPFEPVDRIGCKMVELVADFGNLLLGIADFLLHSLDVELGNLAHRLFDQLEDVFHHNLPAEQLLVLLHRGKNLVELNLPALLVLFQHLVNAVFEENLFKRTVVPALLELIEANLQLTAKQLPGVVGAVFEDIVDAQELRLAVDDDAGIRGDGNFALGEGIQGVYCLVGRHVIRKMDDNLHLVGGHIVYLLDFDFTLVFFLEYGVNHHLRSFSIRDFGDGDGVLVDFFDAGANLDGPAALAGHIFGALGEAAGGEVGVNLVRLALEDGDGSVDELPEVMGQNLRRHTYGDTLGALGEQQGEADRKFGRLLVSAIVGRHPVGDFRVENHLFCEFAQTGLDVTWGGVAVAGEDITPVSLAVDGKTFLADLNQCTKDGSISVGMILHRRTDDIGNLGKTPVVNLVHGVQDTPLHGLQAIDDMRNGPLENHIGRIVQEPVPEHPGQFEFLAVFAKKSVVFAGRHGIFADFLFFEAFVLTDGSFLDIVPVLAHIFSCYSS